MGAAEALAVLAVGVPLARLAADTLRRLAPIPAASTSPHRPGNHQLAAPPTKRRCLQAKVGDDGVMVGRVPALLRVGQAMVTTTGCAGVPGRART